MKYTRSSFQYSAAKTVNVLGILAGCAALLGSTLLGSAPASAQESLYGSQIVAPAKSGEVLTLAVKDLQQTLTQMTGSQFTVTSEIKDTAIVVAKTDLPQVPADAVQKLAGAGPEAFLIRGQNPDKLWIVASDERGLSHGIYYYLEQLGCRWYFPTEAWTIIPSRKNIRVNIDRLVKPDFVIRSFFGTGGFGGALVVDPKLENRERWENWRRRNRFGASMTVGGHTGEEFNNRNKQTLLEHPEYLASVDGKHVPWSKNAKPNIANPEAVKLYVQDRLAEVRKRYADPEYPRPITISAEPGDGGGHCNSPECLEIGGPNEQVFYLTNQVAKAVDKEFPDAIVTVYAYNHHAAVPQAPIEPNVHVRVIPYAFQEKYTGLSPQELIAAWGQKLNKMSIYDYWNIPDWKGDMPFNYLEVPRQKLQYWHDNKITGFSSESTYSSGSMGIAWYLSSRLMWDLKTDEKALLDEFYRLAFGPAQVPMQRMLERWAGDFLLWDEELASSFRDLQEAYELAAGNAPVEARIDDYVRYVQFLRLTNEFREASKTDPEGRGEAARKLTEHIWNIYHSTMIHSFRIHKLMYNRPMRDHPLEEMYRPGNEKATGWKNIKPLTHGELVTMVEDGVKSFQPAGYVSKTYSGEFTLLPTSTLPTPLAAQYSEAFTFQYLTTFETMATSDNQPLPLKIGAQNAVEVTVRDRNEKAVFQQALEANTNTTLDIKLPSRGLYSVRVDGGRFHLQVPSGIHFVVTSFNNTGKHKTGKLYFYVPKGHEAVGFNTPFAFPVQIFDSTGAEVPHKSNVNILIPVPPGQDGKVWSVEGFIAAERQVRALNVPHAFAFFPDTLLVPKDAL